MYSTLNTLPNISNYISNSTELIASSNGRLKPELPRFVKIVNEAEQAYINHYNTVIKYIEILKEIYTYLQNDPPKTDLEKMVIEVRTSNTDKYTIVQLLESEKIRIQESIERTKESINEYQAILPKLSKLSEKILVELNTLHALLNEVIWSINVLYRKQQPVTGNTYLIDEVIDKL